MKKAMRILLCGILCAAMLFGTAAGAFAGKGPSDVQYGEWYAAGLGISIQDGSKNPDVGDDPEEAEEYPLLDQNKVTAYPGAVYDRASNTLTLTDFVKRKLLMTATEMGEDFTLCVKGNCALAGIIVWGGEWGCSLRITGDGKLTLNADKKYENGVYLRPQEGAAVSLVIDPTVSVAIYGSRTAIRANGSQSPVVMTAGGQHLPMRLDSITGEYTVTERGYSNTRDKTILLGNNAADSEGVYEVMENSRRYEDGREEPFVEVSRYIYVPSHGLYLLDYNWAEQYGGMAGSVEYPDMAAANAAGFTQQFDADGMQQSMQIVYCTDYTFKEIFEDPDGNRYAVDMGYDENRNYRKLAYTFVPLEERMNMEYLFLYAPGVDPDALTPVKMTLVNGEAFCYPQTELILNAGEQLALAPGDVDGNGKVEAADARLALRAAVHLSNEPNDVKEGTAGYAAADYDKNGRVEASDARCILRVSVQLDPFG